jgi:uncharacterized protein
MTATEQVKMNESSTPGYEVRAFSVERINIERRQEENEPDTLRLSGHAAVFDSETDIAGLFREVIRRGAFTRAIEERQDVALLLNHDPSTVMARVSNDTLRLAEDAIGLYFEAELDARDPDAVRTVNKIERGNISQMSFAFQATTDQWDHDSRPPLRSIIDTDLFDVSPVTYPAYQQTDVHAREVARQNGVVIPDTPDTLAGDSAGEPSLAARHRKRAIALRRRKHASYNERES